MNVLETKGLFKQYNMGRHIVEALSDVQLEITQGEFVAVMGPSGSGKSTLLHLLGGLDQPTKGAIILAGRQVSGLKDREATLIRRRNVGFVFQFFNLLPTLSAEENIMLPLIIDGKNPRDYKDRLDDMLNRIGLLERRQHRPDQLSGGEQQRVALARALITQPAILLADEPTGNLDTKTGTEMMQLLRKSAKELGQTVVMVTHDSKAAAYADRVIFLRDGAVAEEVELSEMNDAGARLHQIIKTLEKLESMPWD